MYSKSNKIADILTMENLTKWYVEDGLTLKEVANISGVKSPITIAKYMDKHGIPRRNVNKERQAQTMNGMTENEFKDYLYDMYITKSMSLNKISYELKVTANIVKKYLNMYDIPVLSHKDANTKFNTAKLHPRWEGGRNIRSDGYVEVYMPEHPFKARHPYVYEHKVVMEQHIGRYLTPSEEVHHINGNRSDNRIENLMLFYSKEEHMKHHFELNKIKNNSLNPLNDYRDYMKGDDFE